MTSEVLFHCIGLIDDALITRSETTILQFKRRKIVKQIVAVAAAFILLLISPIANLINNSGTSDDTPIEPLRVYTFNGAYYEATSDFNVLNNYGIYEKADEAKIDKYLGQAMSNDVSTGGDVYSICDFESTSVLILEINEEYEYIVYCNNIEEREVSITELLSVHGINSVTDIKNAYALINTSKFSCSSQDVWNLITTARYVTTSDYYTDVFAGISEEEQQSANHDTVVFVVSKGTTQYFMFECYREAGYIYLYNCYYEVSKEALNELLSNT